ncbi:MULTISPECIES: EAL domain-containing protein [unclassified Mesorhizobium]|uniref:putative bifunctional diguanylate cyclase/phosphodiesterase n=1 Tax=unclassified Mesorhizobium TaxID=325217 RepID=UPI000FCC13CC|nr:MULTISPECIES: EAL domain-containing protein [unclassified Mesorhizobium]RUU62050.1 EAL domain-containing protein [Mesorhizobium sp. M7A.T.Ca.TU.009.01.1.1]RUU90105.1 EAL domain-containing protein [Mesorhizobium sp. M7A.T.Ca.TU.009.01.1.2]AZV18405.1 EAL domain-containing protein [Mesorhizobium sp. M7A.F.Ce.TU.012.03.2.1]RUT89510.1 EAL domain-containing protein [Mesorhizobium sp. M7A.T.Ca.US.000.02.1.1]RUT93324.1 EAL domain-containing protein [Mesorhizobium sp. M7A.T.Ca.US.000.02.2.1]
MNLIKKNEIPVDVYIPFVETLFRDGLTLSIGFFAQTLLVVLVYWKTMDPAYLAVTLGLLAVAFLRLRNIRKYRHAPSPQNWEEARRRENDYILYGSMHGFMLGAFCFVGIYLAYDPFAEIAAVCVTLASATSIAGRNYGSPRMVVIFIMTMTWPISLGFILRGDPYHFILGLLSAPFLFAIKRFADLVREVLFAALSEEKKANRIAQRFNRALNTMSHGLVMLGPDGRVAVANAEAAHLMSLKSPDALLGRSIHGLLMRGVAGGMLAPKDCRYIEAQLTRALREGRDRKVLVSLANGQHYEFSAREGSQELGVITFEDVTARVEAEDKIRFMARYDNLTGLPNRAYFHELVGEAMVSGDRDRLCGLAVLDLDDFKSVNDTLGHPIGDGLIYAVAERLAAIARQDITVSRFGGDEFMIFFDRVEDESHLTSQLDEIFAGLQGEVDVAGHGLRIQASGGAVLSRVKDTDVDAMIVKADLALYKAKELGKNSWRLFEASMDAAFRNRQLMKADLRTAVESKGLRVVYQPIVAMSTMRIASCEALCRWDHPDLGPISPSIFIPLAEEMGIISEISTFVLQAACAECAKWPDQTSVSVNLSAKDFRNRDVIQKVRDALAGSGLAASRLEIEVTETALLDDKSLTRQYIEELKQIGVRIALDDFGTGYSSLSYLHKLPLDKIKIDRSFLMDVTQNPRSLELLKGIVNLSRPLGLSVTVEGVETFEQLKILALQVKPDLVQGFLFGSALSASGIETMSNTVWPFAKDINSAKRAARR